MNTKSHPGGDQPIAAEGVHLASMETRHYTFRAAGRTKEEARQALYAAWREHYKQADAERQHEMPNTLAAMEEAFEVSYELLAFGQGYRDGEPLPRKGP